ncbi:hypothetical protein Aple_037440 [Acrocarpospora pleiomorpha]|uniref:Uncharacterized protein n=1 Tax=Acrocarpospora pleiomorpha TaxID=90975 RepID=A0A5M3XR66_9ACTN|nr:hypothetical protein [Acrocarpospora pleiomorpha]GES20848.1 hypothetical protein Aple_037440 [Acrocarpospora pleiomorpha]
MDGDQRILLRGGSVVSMDPAIGDLARGDVLIVGDRIAGAGESLPGEGNHANFCTPEQRQLIVDR